MKTTIVVQVPLLMLLAIITPALALQSQSQIYTFRSDVQGTIYAPAPRTNRSLTFVDRISYVPGTDDDFGFNIIDKGNRAYFVQTAHGNDRSYIMFTLNTWELPDYVGYEREFITLRGNNDYKSVQMFVPEEYTAIAIIELLTYWPGTDDDYGYAVRAYGATPYIIVTAVSDFGNSYSQIDLRVTMLYWPSNIDVRMNNPVRLIANMTGGEQVKVPRGYMWLATPTAYMTDASKYKYEDFDRLLVATYNHSFAGKPPIDVFGFVKNLGNLVEHATQPFVTEMITPQDAIKLTKDVGTLFYQSIKMFNRVDDRDDDFWLVTNSNFNTVEVQIGDGNGYSLAEVTVWALYFGETD